MPANEFVVAAFGASLQVLFDRLANPTLLPFVSGSGIDSVIKPWKEELLMIQAVVNDAEEKQLTNKAVNMWLDDLQQLAYDVEDILDKYATQLELEERKLMTADQPKDIVAGYFSSWMSNCHMKSEIEEVNRRLEDLCKRRHRLGLKEIAGGTSAAAPQRRRATTLQHEPAVIGRDADKAKILEMMSKDEPSDANFRVIPIVGMGGIGKTTLAREVFNDQAVKYFDLKVWVSVSDHDHFDDEKIYRAILAEINFKSSDYDNWENLKAPFMAGAPGSRIIVTTRHLKVVSIMTGSNASHNVKLLSEEECWSVFAKHAFKIKDIAKFPNLEYIRQKVASKCNGLPLAARTLGGLLFSEPRESKWKDILDSKIWEDTLNSKLCIQEKELVRLWMAEGLIQKSLDNIELEDVGGEFFQDLLSRSLFQKSGTTFRFTYVMHDLVNDMAKWASRDTIFRLEDESKINNQSAALKKIRHLSTRCLSNTKIEALHEAVNLRTILDVNCVAPGMDFPFFLPKFKKLRVLSLMGNYYVVNTPQVISLPDTIGDLKHLRYLCVSNTAIISLPESTNSLINLEVLQLRWCALIKKLPPMGNLINLRHLNIEEVNLIEMPLGMENWKNLRTLSNFVVGKDISSRLDVLKNFKRLRGELRISKLENATSFSPEAILCDKEKLDKLWLDWDWSNECPSEEVQKNVLDILRPHKNLKSLGITGYVGTQFPDWLGDLSSSLTFLETIKINHCKKLQCLL
ncbi:putative disease resistance RPP13-like protein 1 [Pistacia vera]|uniref:putative disease resistance RPP13-like protein 1 n=1 Tax=Pistacia vera TaxID=55513 RepID=UPI001262E4A6|nr:putative disease resistance RPP13-like protein 1 [Pistacia vera]